MFMFSGYLHMVSVRIMCGGGGVIICGGWWWWWWCDVVVKTAMDVVVEAVTLEVTHLLYATLVFFPLILTFFLARLEAGVEVGVDRDEDEACGVDEAVLRSGINSLSACSIRSILWVRWMSEV